MKIFSRFTPLLVMGMLAITIALSGCGKDALQKAVKDAFIKGDTTETTYQAICDIITGKPEKISNARNAKLSITILQTAGSCAARITSLPPMLCWKFSLMPTAISTPTLSTR